MKKKPRRKAKPSQQMERGYREQVAVGGTNSDWGINLLGEDADVWQNAWLLTARMRDLFRTNPLFTKYRELLWANVFGENGILLRNKAMETEDRIVYTPDEKLYLWKWEQKINRLREHAAKMDGQPREQYRAFHLADSMERRSFDVVTQRQAKVSAGELDLYANSLIQRLWLDWQKAKNCDTRKGTDYKTHRQIRLISAVSDGDCFIRMVSGKSVNKYGFALQLIGAEWCDRFYNTILPNGNVVRMGIEYKWNPWGLGEPVAYYFITRQPMDWQFSTPASFMTAVSSQVRTRIEAEEIVHYRRIVCTGSTRPAPWCASTIVKARQLDQYELAEVIAARRMACKVGFYWSELTADAQIGAQQGGDGAYFDPNAKFPREEMAPGESRKLPWGWKYQQVDPKHPTANFEAFRKGMLRSDCAGMPGADYSRMANDYEAINFSAGRLQMLDTNETYKMLQRFDIDYAETEIFENWLNMALITGAIPLPVSKFDKFNQPFFQAKRWRGVDEVKEEQASAMRIANKKNSRQREVGDEGEDFFEILMELAEEEMAMQELGMNTNTTAEALPKTEELPSDDDEEGDEPPASSPSKKPKPKNPKGGKSETVIEIAA